MAIKLRLKTPTEIRRALARVANMTANGEMDAKTANSIILACNAILGAIRIDEQYDYGTAGRSSGRTGEQCLWTV